MLTDEHIPQDLIETVQRELKPEERVLWFEMPIPTFFTSKNTQMLIFSIVWILFSLFWIGGAASFTIPNAKDAPGVFQLMGILFPIFGLPFVFIGFGMLTIPFFNYRSAWKTIYVITDRRAITFGGVWSREVRSFPPEKLKNIYRKERSDGTGDVIISYKEWVNADDERRTEDLGFLRIREPKRVEQMLRDLAREGGIDILPQDSVIKESKPSFSTIEERFLPRSRAGIRLGKLLSVLILSVCLGYLFHTSSIENYQKGQNITFNEYAEGYEEHRAKLLDQNSLWQEVLYVFLFLGFLICSYELMGKVVGWAFWRISLRRKGEKFPPNNTIDF